MLNTLSCFLNVPSTLNKKYPCRRGLSPVLSVAAHTQTGWPPQGRPDALGRVLAHAVGADGVVHQLHLRLLADRPPRVQRAHHIVLEERAVHGDAHRAV
eukprot:766541-Hanusia_phi.AAC.2